mgnify:CR=1 FL=1
MALIFFNNVNSFLQFVVKPQNDEADVATASDDDADDEAEKKDEDENDEEDDEAADNPAHC